MGDKMDDKKMIKFSGPKKESIFHCYIAEFLSTEASQEFQEKVDGIMSKVMSIKNDRLLVLLGALIIENSLDEFLSTIIFKYKTLRDNRDFTFSMKILLAKSFRYIPNFIFNSVDCVRVMRNDFIHDLSIDSFEKMAPEKLQSMKQHLSNFVSEKYPSNDSMFRNLVLYTSLALFGYSSHVLKLSSFLRSKDFMKSLVDHIEKS